MTESCPQCSSSLVRVLVSHERQYGRYRLMKCRACQHRWNIKSANNTPKTQYIRPGSHSCPECNSQRTRSIESRMVDGYRRRRIECRDCSHRWTVKDNGDKTPFRLTPEIVRRALESPASHRTLAVDLKEELNIPIGAVNLSRQIGDARSGRNYGHLFPELRPWIPASCHQCRHWELGDERADDRCGMGFPDPIHEGPRFAADCVLFAR